MAHRDAEEMRKTLTGEFDGTILIADDHDVVRLGLIPLLKHWLGAQNIVEAQRFEEAIAHLEQSDVKLAIVDLGMPGLKGPQDLARMRSVCPQMRVVVLSASESRKDIIDALSAGAHGYIVKSQRTDELVRQLRYVLSGEIYVPPILADSSVPSPEATIKGGAQTDPRNLSGRQRQVLKCLVEGKSNKEIAQELKVAQGTVKMHLAALFRVLGATNRAHAAALGKQFIG